MSLGTSQRIVLITGSNRGIGLETARQLARRQFHVIIAARDEERGRQAAEGIQAGGGTGTFLFLDVTSSQSIRPAVRKSLTAWTFSSTTPAFTQIRDQTS